MLGLPYILMFMFSGAFVINFFILSYIKSNVPENVYMSLGKIYISIVAAGLCTLVELMINDFVIGTVNWTFYLILILIIGSFTLLYRTQTFISGRQYLKFSIEEQSNLLLPAMRAIEKSESKTLSDKVRFDMKNAQANMNMAKKIEDSPNI